MRVKFYVDLPDDRRTVAIIDGRPSLWAATHPGGLTMDGWTRHSFEVEVPGVALPTDAKPLEQHVRPTVEPVTR